MRWEPLFGWRRVKACSPYVGNPCVPATKVMVGAKPSTRGTSPHQSRLRKNTYSAEYGTLR